MASQTEGAITEAPHIRQTSNMALAVTLFTSGVPIPTNEKGNPKPVGHFYDRETLKRLGYEGWPLEKAAADAIEKKRPGVVVYSFVDCPQYAEIAKAWDDQSQLIKDADTSAGGTGTNKSGALEIVCECGKCIPVPESIVARICCQFHKNRKVYVTLWQKVKALVVHSGSATSSPKKDSFGNTIGGTLTGSFKAVPIGASAETKRRAGL